MRARVRDNGDEFTKDQHYASPELQCVTPPGMTAYRYVASPRTQKPGEEVRRLNERARAGARLRTNRIGVPEQPFASEQTTRDITLERVREIRQTLEAQGVRHAFLFGSVARGDDVPESDIDIVLDLDPDRHIGLFAFESIGRF